MSILDDDQELWPYQEVWFGAKGSSERFMKVLGREAADLLQMLDVYGWLNCQIDYGHPLKYLVAGPFPRNSDDAV